MNERKSKSFGNRQSIGKGKRLRGREGRIDGCEEEVWKESKRERARTGEPGGKGGK